MDLKPWTFLKVRQSLNGSSKPMILPKNERMNFFLGLTVLNMNLFVRFLVESEDTKKSFQNYLTFKKYFFSTLYVINEKKIIPLFSFILVFSFIRKFRVVAKNPIGKFSSFRMINLTGLKHTAWTFNDVLSL